MNKFFNKLSDKQKHMIVGFMCGFAYFPFPFFFDFNIALFCKFIFYQVFCLSGKKFTTNTSRNRPDLIRLTYSLIISDGGWACGSGRYY